MTTKNKALKVLARPEVVEVIKEVDELLLSANALSQAVAYQAQSFFVEAFDEGLGSLVSTITGSVTEESIATLRKNIFSVIEPKLESEEMRKELSKAVRDVLVKYNLEQIKNEAYRIAIESIPALKEEDKEISPNYKRKEVNAVVRDDLDDYNDMVYQVLRTLSKKTNVITHFDKESFTLNDSIKFFFDLRLPIAEEKEMFPDDEMVLDVNKELPNGFIQNLHLFALRSDTELVHILKYVIEYELN